MKDFKGLLALFIEVVTFLFAAFGGFLKRIAPPDPVGAAYPVGIMSFLMLGILLFISAMSRHKATPAADRKWIIAGVALFLLALPPSFLYPYLLSLRTYPHQSELRDRQISASDEYLTSDARRYKLSNPEATAEDLTHNLPDGDVWSQAGLERTELELLVVYSCLVLTLSGTVFCLLEANIRRQAKASSGTASSAT
jgi:hypothetical protein